MSDFHKRFEIKIDIEEARKRFINRVCNDIFDGVTDSTGVFFSFMIPARNRKRIGIILSALGKRYEDKSVQLSDHINTNDFREVLRTIEAIHSNESAVTDNENDLQDIVSKKVDKILAQSELDIGIRWQDGKFWPRGAKLLDEQLVNDPLEWLRTDGHSTVVEPFEKALRHFSEVKSRPQGLPDVITNAYMALEALVKIVLGNDRDLSQNREKFVHEIKGTEFHKNILKEYVGYGCNHRHAADPKSPRSQPSNSEAEFFLYFTGAVIRLAKENWEGS